MKKHSKPIILIVSLFIFFRCNTGYTEQVKLFTFQYDSSKPLINIALIIPGMDHSASTSGYDSIEAFYENSGITPLFVNIQWKVIGINKLSLIAQQIQGELRDSFPQSTVYLFGFSFGAVISLKLSQLIQAKHILLCSMSPLFDEDRVHQIFPFSQLLGCLTDYSTNGLSYALSKEMCCTFLYGDHDSFVINKNIIKYRKEFFTCNETQIIANAKHDISGKSYLSAVKKIVEGIDNE
jgi:hypothetical protein